MALLTETRFLTRIDPIQYYADILPIRKKPSRIQGSRRGYKLAYLIMAREEDSFENLKHLISLIDDGMAFIMIHIDLKYPSYRKNVKDWLKEKDEPNNGQGNVYLTRKSFRNIFGHISLVYTQLSAFWEMQDMVDFEYAINLSCYDYPLRRNQDIYRTLSMSTVAEKSWISHWNSLQGKSSGVL